MSNEEEETGSRSGSKSTTPNSTSTCKYGQESFTTFQHKVETLSKSLGRFEDVTVEHIRGGSFNRIVLARLTPKSDNFLETLLSRVNGIKLVAIFTKRLSFISRLMKRSEAKTLDGVFRVPRDPNISDEENEQNEAIGDEHKDSYSQVDSEILDQAAVLQFLGGHDIPAPLLLAFDATAANAISTPYVFQEYSDASALDLIFDKMSLTEKLSVADALVDALLSMERVGFQKAGSLLAAESLEMDVKGSYLPGGHHPSLEVVVCGHDVKTSRGSHDFKAYDSTYDLISTQLKARHQEDLEENGEGPVSVMFERLLEICEDMKDLGFFSAEDESSRTATTSILYHWDLMPRNILVKPAKSSLDNHHSSDGAEPAESGWMMDKIIDWDRVLAVPPILARMPPLWLWDFSDDAFHSSRPSIGSDYDGDADLHLPTRYDAEGGRLSPADQQVREHFEERFVAGLAEIYGDYDKERYQDEAYGRGRYIRRLARFALHRACYGQDWKRFDHLDEEWDTARLQFVKD